MFISIFLITFQSFLVKRGNLNIGLIYLTFRWNIWYFLHSIQTCPIISDVLYFQLFCWLGILSTISALWFFKLKCNILRPFSFRNQLMDWKTFQHHQESFVKTHRIVVSYYSVLSKSRWHPSMTSRRIHPLTYSRFIMHVQIASFP